jgi:hypothetical protein
VGRGADPEHVDPPREARDSGIREPGLVRHERGGEVGPHARAWRVACVRIEARRQIDRASDRLTTSANWAGSLVSAA